MTRALRLWACAACLAAAPALGQEITATGGTLRVLDRQSDRVQDLDLATGGAGEVGRLTIQLQDCRYPQGELAESIARLVIRDGETEVFSGWMLATSPALNALDHPRYDVWLLACTAAEGGNADGG